MVGRKRNPTTQEQDNLAKEQGTFVAEGQNWHIKLPKTEEQKQKAREYAKERYTRLLTQTEDLREQLRTALKQEKVETKRPTKAFCEYCHTFFQAIPAQILRHNNTKRHLLVKSIIDQTLAQKDQSQYRETLSPHQNS